MKRFALVAAVIFSLVLAGGALQVARYSIMKKQCLDRYEAISRRVLINLMAETSDQNARVFAESLMALDGVQAVDYIPTAEALAELKAAYADDKYATNKLTELKENPFMPTIVVEFENYSAAIDVSLDARIKEMADSANVGIKNINRGYAQKNKTEISHFRGFSPFVGIARMWNESADYAGNLIELCAKGE